MQVFCKIFLQLYFYGTGVRQSEKKCETGLLRENLSKYTTYIWHSFITQKFCANFQIV